MKATRIQYTVQPGFVEQNKQNVAKVMAELRAANHPGLRYSTYILEDGKTFMHLVMFNDEQSETVIPNLASFKHFQSELRGSSPEVLPKVDNLTIVGSSYELFGS
jgi:hypothetical protein